MIHLAVSVFFAAQYNPHDCVDHGLHEGTTTLPKGHQKLEGRSKPLPCDMVFDRDTPVPLRDGVRIRIDTFRPYASFPCTEQRADDGAGRVMIKYQLFSIGVLTARADVDVSFLSSSSTCTKRAIEPNLCDMPFRAGIAESRLSGYEKFEGTDPAE